MKSTIPNYGTYSELEADVSNLRVGQIVSCEETLRLYRIDDSNVITPLTNGANFSLSGTTLTISY